MPIRKIRKVRFEETEFADLLLKLWWDFLIEIVMYVIYPRSHVWGLARFILSHAHTLPNEADQLSANRHHCAGRPDISKQENRHQSLTKCIY